MALVLNGPQTGNRPSCWGRTDVYDGNDRECRGCGFQVSCREQVLRVIQSTQPVIPQIPNPPPMTQPSYYQNFLTPNAPAPLVPVAPPQPVPFNPAQPVQIMKFGQPPTVPQVPQMFQQPQVAPPPQMFAQRPALPVPVTTQPPVPQAPQQARFGDWYGRAQDPLHFALFQPPPFRPQMEGETFFERVGKNLALDLGTMFFFHLGLALRQMILPPAPPAPVTPVERHVSK